jgi:hypothetical protein
MSILMLQTVKTNEWKQWNCKVEHMTGTYTKKCFHFDIQQLTELKNNNSCC